MSWLMWLERPEVTLRHVAVQNGGSQADQDMSSFPVLLLYHGEGG